MSKRNVFLCGVPREHCVGHTYITDQQLAPKCHDSPVTAFKCYRRYLVKILGYTQTGGREFKPPDGGPRLILTKKSRFGGRLRQGKRTDKATSNRYMPYARTRGVVY